MAVLTPVTLTDPVQSLWAPANAAVAQMNTIVSAMEYTPPVPAPPPPIVNPALALVASISAHIGASNTSYGTLPGQLQYVLPAYNSSIGLKYREETSAFGLQATLQFAQFTNAFDYMAASLTALIAAINSANSQLTAYTEVNPAVLSILSGVDSQAATMESNFGSWAPAGLAGQQDGYSTLKAMSLSQFCHGNHSAEFQAILDNFYQP